MAITSACFQRLSRMETDQGRSHLLRHQNFVSALVLLSICLLPACGLISNQSVYEGVRGHEKAKSTGATQKPSVLPNYDQYEKEREVLKNKLSSNIRIANFACASKMLHECYVAFILSS